MTAGTPKRQATFRREDGVIKSVVTPVSERDRLRAGHVRQPLASMANDARLRIFFPCAACSIEIEREGRQRGGGVGVSSTSAGEAGTFLGVGLSVGAEREVGWVSALKLASKGLNRRSRGGTPGRGTGK